MMRNKRLLLVDSYYLFYRSHYAFVKNPLKNSKGEETSVIVGFLNTICTLLQKRMYDWILFAMDSKAKTFRHKMYTPYKANRPPMPEVLIEQIKFAKALIADMGLPVIKMDGVEADDIMATYARRLEAKENVSVEIFASDKDLLQVLGPSVSLIGLDKYTKELCFQTPQTVQERYALPPSAINDYLSLVGDSSDNVPGSQEWALKVLQPSCRPTVN